MKTWKTTGLALTACLAFAAAACQAEVKDDAASKGSGVTVTGNNDQSVTATGGGSNKAGGPVHVKENVDQITVTGSDVKVLAKTAKKVSIQGSNVKVFVERVSSVDFNGSDNEVEWANGSRPKINDNGSDNKVEKAD